MVSTFQVAIVSDLALIDHRIYWTAVLVVLPAPFLNLPDVSGKHQADLYEVVQPPKPMIVKCTQQRILCRWYAYHSTR